MADADLMALKRWIFILRDSFVTLLPMFKSFGLSPFLPLWIKSWLQKIHAVAQVINPKEVAKFFHVLACKLAYHVKKKASLADWSSYNIKACFPWLFYSAIRGRGTLYMFLDILFICFLTCQAKKEEEEFNTGPLSVLMMSVKNNTQVSCIILLCLFFPFNLNVI